MVRCDDRGAPIRGADVEAVVAYAASLPNGVRARIHYVYDDGSQVTSITHAKGDNVVLGFTYEYDFHGMPTGRGPVGRRHGRKVSLRYDILFGITISPQPDLLDALLACHPLDLPASLS